MTKESNITQLKIGVLGGGQLGRMFALEAAKFGVHPYFLDQAKEFPAGLISNNFQLGDFNNYDDVLNFGKDKDIVTIEIENVNTDALKDLKKMGIEVYPDPSLIEMIKDKGVQKEFYEKEGFPTSDFQLVENKAEILALIQAGQLSIPFVQKSRKEGYDGKGVQLVKNEKELNSLFDCPSIIEPLVDMKKELAVIVTRNKSGDIKTYPSVEMVFDPEANLVDYLQYPAEIEPKIEAECQRIAREMATNCKLIGLLAIEFFLTSEGKILINEMAPRTHNSGHLTMDGSRTSQFEQQLRSLFNLKLGPTEYPKPALMLNLLGKLEYQGPYDYLPIDEICKYPGVHLHLYGKMLSKPKRKLGHINIVNENLDKAKEILFEIKKLVN